MTTFRDVPQPDLDRMRTNVPIVRCDRSNHFKLGFLCLSPKVVGTEVHFAGKTVPCLAPDEPCQWCEAGRRLAWVGYVSGTDQARTKNFLVEFTPGAMQDVAPFAERFHTLRGAWIQLTRPSRRDTGRVVAELQRNALGLAPSDLPRPCDVRSALEKIWGLSKANEQQESEAIRNQGIARDLKLPERYVPGKLNGQADGLG